MTVYFEKGRGYRYVFKNKGKKYSGTYYQKKKDARKAELERRFQLERNQSIKTDMVFLELVNLRLDHLKAYKSEIYYQETVYKAKQWVELWGDMLCSEIDQDMIEMFVLKRNRVSPQTANKEIRYLRSLFNFGIRKKFISFNPVDGIDFIPVEKKDKFIPTPEQIQAVIDVADPETKDYLVTIRETMARVGEINRLTWDDVNFEARYLVLYTRKKKGGHLTPRRIPMTDCLFDLLRIRHSLRDVSKTWVFWHTFYNKDGEQVQGPYQDRKKIMRTLCRKAGVPYFRFHALRHSGASIMDQARVPIGSIQRILGHESRATTEIYLHSVRQSERDAMTVFEDERRKALSKALSDSGVSDSDKDGSGQNT